MYTSMVRPFLPKGERRNHSLTARFNDEERALITSIARCDHVTTSDAIRELCMYAIKAQTIDKCHPCKLEDMHGNIKCDMDTLDPACFKCIMKKMIKASGEHHV